MGNGRQHQLHRPGALGDLRHRGVEYAQQTPDLAQPAAGQYQNDWRLRLPALLLGRIGSQLGKALDQRMADIQAGRTAKLQMARRLERQNGENLIDISAHGARTSGSPGPDRRRDVIDDRNLGRRAAHPAGDPMGEVRAVDDDERVGPRRDDGVRGLANAPQDQRQPPRNGAEPENRQLLDGKRALDAGRGHGPPANAGQRQRAAIPGAERANQCCAQRIAGFLRGDQIDRKRPRQRPGHRAVTSGTPMTKIFSRSAAAATAAGSAMMVLPAVTATPASPARTAFAIVRGPIVGRSKRRS